MTLELFLLLGTELFLLITGMIYGYFYDLKKREINSSSKWEEIENRSCRYSLVFVLYVFMGVVVLCGITAALMQEFPPISMWIVFLFVNNMITMIVWTQVYSIYKLTKKVFNED